MEKCEGAVYSCMVYLFHMTTKLLQKYYKNVKIKMPKFEIKTDQQILTSSLIFE